MDAEIIASAVKTLILTLGAVAAAAILSKPRNRIKVESTYKFLKPNVTPPVLFSGNARD